MVPIIPVGLVGSTFLHGICTLLLCIAYCVAQELKPYALVLPLPSKSQLSVEEEGITFLKSIPGPVAPVIVIGPYRSGKSFLLNQLLGVPCGQGFGVGHTRETQTKGIWIWGVAQTKTEANGQNVSLLYIDTEGFESTGKTNSYDDRIFTLSTVLSSVLIYNLAETVRESDISKLSFAVQLAQGFFSKYKSSTEQANGGGGQSLDPNSMLWLIQRDLLQGKTADQMVKEALAPVPNPNKEADIDQLNRIRASLSTIAANSSGYSLAQPHLDRTKLCEMSDSQLAAQYVEQRDKLKELVRDLAKPKHWGGRALDGPALADLLQQMVKALNSQEIPNVLSLIDAFNRDLVQKSLAKYNAMIDMLQVPVDESELDRADFDAREAALKIFNDNLLGRSQVPGDQDECMSFLLKNMPEADKHTITTEFLQSTTRLALQARQTLPWGESVPWDIFLDYVLPYAHVDEPREDWRSFFFGILTPLVSGCESAGEAALLINRDIWKLWDIYFKSDQTPEIMAPSQVIRAGYASCTGLSIFLASALRTVGIPARVAGTPSWVSRTRSVAADGRFNNHNWVEVWHDGLWSFTGAAEYTDAGWNTTWFYPDPVQHQIPGDKMHAVYAAKYAHDKGTKHFPLAWNPHYKGVPAVDVTTSYLGDLGWRLRRT